MPAQSRDTSSLKVALVHYWLLRMRGGEKVLEELAELFPQADIYTHVVDEANISAALASHRIITTFVGRLPFARRMYKKYLPLMPWALEELDLGGYDLVISSESGPAKGVITNPETLHVCYCHTPMRYLWTMRHDYRRKASWISRAVMGPVLHYLRQWDVHSAARVDHFIANSSAVAARIAKFYRRESVVIPPPIDTQAFGPIATPQDYYLYCGHLVAYKRADLAIEACNRLGKRLIVIGGGEEFRNLSRIAGPTVSLLGPQPSDVLRHHFAHCRALLFPTEEDFGMVPVECMASGRPVIALGKGGARDSMVDGVTGVLFDSQRADDLCAAIERFEANIDRFDPVAIAKHAGQFDRRLFRARFHQQVMEWLAAHKNGQRTNS